MEPERQTTHTHIERERGGGSGLAFIVGGLLVAVLVIAYFMFGGSDPWIGGGDTTVSVESSTGATAGAEAPAGTAPGEGGATATGEAATETETAGEQTAGTAATGTATTEPAQN